MATVIGPPTQNPYGAAFGNFIGGVGQGKLQQKNWNKFLDMFGGQNAQAAGGGSQQPITNMQQQPGVQSFPSLGVGAGIAPSGMPGPRNPFANAQQVPPGTPNMGAMRPGMLGGMGRGIGGMLGGGQQQRPQQGGFNPMAMSPMQGMPGQQMNPMMQQILQRMMGR